MNRCVECHAEMPTTGPGRPAKRCDKCQHGNYSSYINRGCRCEPCRTAAADYQRERRFQIVYGLAPGQYAELLDEQGGVCAICEQPETRQRAGIITALSVDHDHDTGTVRGLLCFRCNVQLEAIERADWLDAALRYLGRL